MKDPKTARLDFFVTPQMREEIMAISHLTGQGGNHANLCRQFLRVEIDKFLASLTPPRRAEYNALLARVKLSSDGKDIDI